MVMTIFEQVDFLIGVRDRFGISLDYERILQGHYTRFLNAGDVVFDIGGNEGVHAGKFAEIVGSSGRILIFEPIAHLARQLQKHYEPNQSFVEDLQRRALELPRPIGFALWLEAFCPRADSNNVNTAIRRWSNR